MHREFATRDRATAACAAGGNMQIRNHEALAGLEFVLTTRRTRLNRPCGLRLHLQICNPLPALPAATA
jgi:hypothetical protein